MRAALLQLAVAVVFAGLCALPGAHAAPPEPTPGSAVSTGNDHAFDLPYNRDARQRLAAARDYLMFKDVPWNIVCPLLQSILESRPDTLIEVREVVGGKVQTRRASARAEADRLIASLPPEGRKAYHATYGPTANVMLVAALTGRDPDLLADLSRRYSHTGAGAAATALLAAAEAERRAVPEAAVALWTGRYGNAGRNRVAGGRRPGPTAAFAPLDMLHPGRRDDRPNADKWIATELRRAFDPTSNTKPTPLPGFFPVATSDVVVYRAYDGIYAVATRDFMLRGDLQKAGKVAWVAPTDFGVHQLVADGDENPSGDTSMRDQALRWWATHAKASGSGLIAENPLIGSLSHDGQNVYFIDDVAIPPPPVSPNPNFGLPGVGDALKMSGRLAQAVRAGELVAVDASTGLRVWSLGRVIPVLNDAFRPPPPLTEEEADKETSAFRLCANAVFLGPPLPLDGRLYVLIESDGIVRLLCLNPKTLVDAPNWHLKVPDLLWAQKIGRPLLAVTLDPTRRCQGAFLTAGEGVLVCPTNSGTVVAIEIATRRLLWAHSYPRIAGLTVGRPGADEPAAPDPPADRWRAAAPVVSGGRVVLAAYDSKTLDCLGVRTGKLLWSTSREAGDLYVGGVVDDTVVVVGKAGVRGLRLVGEDPATLKPKEVWKLPLEAVHPAGHGVATGAGYLLPVRVDKVGQGDTFASEIWTIDVATGAVSAKTAVAAPHGLGNLVVQDKLLLSQSVWDVAAYPLK